MELDEEDGVGAAAAGMGYAGTHTAPAPLAGAGAPSVGLSTASPVFGLVVPGRSVQVEFARPAADRFVLALPAATAIAEICIFTLPGMDLPAHLGVAVYWAVAPYTSFTLLGTLTATKPSAVFRTNWKDNHDVMKAGTVQIGLKVESATFISNLSESAAAMESAQEDFAMLVAQDMYNYMGSFAQATPGGQQLIVPVNVLEQWMKRFKTKYRKDASFLKKKGV